MTVLETEGRAMPTRAVSGSTLVGTGVWLLSLGLSWAGLYPLTMIEQLFLLAPLVVVPQRLALTERLAFTDQPPWLFRAGRVLQPWAALPAVAAFYLPPGAVAAWLASGWMLVTALLGLAGMIPFLRRVFTKPHAAGFEAGLLYLPVGGIWLLLSRLGHEPIGLDEPIILLTAVHFHFSGFAACVYAACASQVLRLHRDPAGGLFHFANLGVIGGTFLVAIGFLLSPEIKLAAILLYAGSLVTLAVLVAGDLSKVEHRSGRRLLALSVASLAFGMLLAAVYGFGEVRKELLITIPQMADVHGPVNGIGFAVFGLLGWSLIHGRSLQSHAGFPVTGPRCSASVELTGS